jgi:hypothetical protein
LKKEGSSFIPIIKHDNEVDHSHDDVSKVNFVDDRIILVITSFILFSVELDTNDIMLKVFCGCNVLEHCLGRKESIDFSEMMGRIIPAWFSLYEMEWISREIESQGIKTFELPFLDVLGTTLRALVCTLTTSSVSLTLTKSLIGVQLRLSPLEGIFLGFLFITIYFKITLFKQKAIVGIRIQGIFNKQSKKTFFF